MPFVTRCPSCRKKMRFSENAAGSSRECPRCHNFFTVAPEEEMVVPETWRFRDSEVPAGSDGISAATTATSTREAVPVTAPAAVLPVCAAPAEDLLSSPQRTFNPWGVASFLLGSVGLACASFAAVDLLTIPLAAIGLCGAILGLSTEESRRRGVLLPALGTAVCLPVLILAIFSPTILSESYGRHRTPRRPDAKILTVIPSRGDHKPEVPRPADDAGLDIDEGGIRQGNIQVRVLRAYRGTVAPLGKPAESAPPEDVVTFVLRVSNVGTTEKVHYESWGAATAGADHAPRLQDDTGRSLALKNLGRRRTVNKQFPGNDLPPGNFVDDRLVFPKPPGEPRYLLLELPASAVGSEGAFKFKIPKHKIADTAPFNGRMPWSK